MISLRSNTDRAHNRQEMYAQAERSMRRGKRLVIGGFLLAFVGIVAYCIVSSMTGSSHQPATMRFGEMSWLTVTTLAAVGLGTLFWLVGAFVYVMGSFNCDPSGPDLYF